MHRRSCPTHLAIQAVLALGLASLTQGATYYVDAASGNNGYAGDASHPWATITYALGSSSPVGAGDTILVRGGTYREQITPTKTGSSDKWITVRGYPGETAVIDGTEAITGWTQAQSSDPFLTVQGVVNPHYANIYWARVPASRFPASLSQTILFENRTMCRIASNPDQSVGWGEETAEMRPVTGGDGQNAYFLDSTLTQADDYWNGAIVRVFMYNQNANVVQTTIADFTHADGKVVFGTATDYNVRCDGTWKDRYRLVNHPHVLDTTGEFYVSGVESVGGTDYRRVYHWPASTANLTSNMSIPSRPHGLYAGGAVARYLVIDGLTVYGTTSHGIYFEGTGYSSPASYVKVQNCSVSDCGGHGMFLVFLSNSAALNNTVRRCNDRGILAIGPYRVVVKGNDSGDTGSTNISFYNASASMMINNTVRGIRGGHGNGTSVYGRTSASDPNCVDILLAGNTYCNTNMSFQYSENITVFGNLFVGNPADPAYSITPWTSSYNGNMVFMNNTIPLSATHALSLSQAQSAFPGDIPHYYVANNVLYGLSKGWDQTWDAYDPAKVVVEDRSYNAYTAYMWQQQGYGWSLKTGEQDLRSSALSALFINPVYMDGDWRPKAGGPLQGKGKNVQTILTNLGIKAKFPEYDFTKDLAGNAWSSTPSIGCYEYGVPDPNNHAPVLASIGGKSVAEGSALGFSVSATDSDGDALTYSASGLPTGATFSGQTFAWTPAVGKAGSYQVTFTVSDGRGGQDSEAVAITVTAVAGVNHAPVLASIGNKPVVKGNTLTFSVSATDVDGDTLTYSVSSGLPSGATFSGQTFTWKPAYDQVGSYPVTFSVTDGKGGTDTETVTIQVTDINHVPVLASIGNKSVTVNATLSFTVSATDADGDTLGYTTSPLPTGATFANRTFNWKPASAGSAAITFFVSDGQATASETITIKAVAAAGDTRPPRVSKKRPAGRIQAPTNTLVALEITDDDSGVDAGSVTVLVDNQTAYTGDATTYDSAVGLTTRTGTATAYTYSLQPSADLGYDREVSVIVTASDVAGNTMDPCSCSFTTEMRSFGRNLQVSSNPTNLDKAHAVTAADSSGNVWIAWQAGASGSRDIYAARLDRQTGQLGQASQLTTDSADQYNPALAVSPNDQVYVVWQDYGRGNWDICGSRCADGVTWSGPTRLSDSNDQEVNPAIAIDPQSPHHVVVAWQDNRVGNDNIVVASADASLLGQTTWQVTSSAAAAHTNPALAIAADKTITVVWADYRNGSADVYGASSSNSFGTNVALVTGSGNQTDPAIAIGSEGTVLHLVWVDDSAGNPDILYATFEGLPSSSLTGANLIDDTSGAQQTSPTIQVGQSGIFACWTDSRSVGGSSDADLYFADLASGACRTNVLVGDEQTNTHQTEPALGVDAEGHPYLVWMDSRGAIAEIYYAGSTYVSSEPLKSAVVTAAAGGTVGTPPTAIATLDDISAVVPAGACTADLTIKISRIQNTPAASQDFLAAYDFGPSGLQFALPVTVTVPYTPSGDGKAPTPCWYDPQTDTFSQDGISDVRQVVISSTLHAVSFKTTHFTQYYVAASSGTLPTSGGGGGGGCSVAPDCGRYTVLEFAIPYLGLAVAMVGLRLRDRRRLRA